jgi:cell cycle sensor histidine kinase DivJ
VSLSDSLSRTLRALVHPDRRDDPAQALRHRLFIGERLAVSFAALAAAPLALALHGAPGPATACAFACLMGPLAAAMVASRSGDLDRAQMFHVAGLIGAIAALTLSGAAPGAMVWLVALPAQASLSLRRGSAVATASVCALVGLVLAIAGAPAPSVAELVAFVGAGAFYGAWLAHANRLERRLNEALAAQANARQRLLVDTLGDLAMECDRAGSVVGVLCGAATFGLVARDITGRGFFERLHVQDRPAFLAAVSRAANGDVTATTTARLRVGARHEDHDGDVPVFAAAELRCRAGQPGRAGECPVVIVIARDASAAHRLAEAAQAARAQAESQSLWKDRFLANVSHELRTPLNAVIGFSDLMRSTGAPCDEARRIEYAAIINDAGQHLLSMVNSLLDVSKIEAGRFALQPETVGLPQLADQVIEMVRLRAEQGGVSVRATIHPLAAEIVADKRACRQILTNLVANAVKFTGEGGSVEVLARPEGNSVAIEVVDTGCGIAARDLARLGDAFFQASADYDRAHEGVGLGLSLTRGLVGLHGGAIAIDSAPGEGTRVVVTLPLDCRAAQSEAGAPARIETSARRTAQIVDAARPGAAAALDLFRKAG